MGFLDDIIAATDGRVQEEGLMKFVKTVPRAATESRKGVRLPPEGPFLPSLSARMASEMIKTIFGPRRLRLMTEKMPTPAAAVASRSSDTVIDIGRESPDVSLLAKVVSLVGCHEVVVGEQVHWDRDFSFSENGSAFALHDEAVGESVAPHESLARHSEDSCLGV